MVACSFFSPNHLFFRNVTSATCVKLKYSEVKGRSDLFLKLEIIKKIIAVIPISLGIFYGIEFMLWGSVFISFIAIFLNSYFSAELINYPTFLQIKDILPTFLISFVVAAMMWSLTKLEFSNWFTLLLQCSTGIIAAFTIYEIIKLPEYMEVKEIVLSTINKKIR
jgi:hypothetical protein